ncbi:MAG: thermonuclease family protein [Desulfuromusa sp.]
MLPRSALLLFLLLLLATAVSAQKLTGRVLWIYDGDTLKVENIGKVRLIGIDTPETKASSRDHFYKRDFHINPGKLRQISRQAKNYNLHYVKGKKVRLELDQTVRDKYNRLLAYVYLPDGEMLNLLLLKKGLATVFRRYDFQYKKKFLKVEKNARKKELGLWN